MCGPPGGVGARQAPGLARRALKGAPVGFWRCPGLSGGSFRASGGFFRAVHRVLRLYKTLILYWFYSVFFKVIILCVRRIRHAPWRGVGDPREPSGVLGGSLGRFLGCFRGRLGAPLGALGGALGGLCAVRGAGGDPGFACRALEGAPEGFWSCPGGFSAFLGHVSSSFMGSSSCTNTVDFVWVYKCFLKSDRLVRRPLEGALPGSGHSGDPLEEVPVPGALGEGLGRP